MDATVFAWLGTAALLTSWASLEGRVTDQVLGSTFAVVLWWVWAFHAYSVTTDAGTTESYGSLAILGVLAGLLMLVLTAKHGFGSINGGTR